MVKTVAKKVTLAQIQMYWDTESCLSSLYSKNPIEKNDYWRFS